jgi:type IV pilus assembly protein PilV
MKRDKGFSLIEVLVTLLITSVGLLGLAVLQAKSLQFNHGAYLRSQANILAYDIADRMRLNKDDARAGQYNISMGSSKPSASDLVTTDQNQWLTLIETSLPAGDGSVSCVSNICTLTIQWREAGRNADDSFTYKTQI